jgi:hypothetical protein
MTLSRPNSSGAVSMMLPRSGASAVSGAMSRSFVNTSRQIASCRSPDDVTLSEDVRANREAVTVRIVRTCDA